MVIFLLRGKHGGAYTPPAVTVHYFTDMIGNSQEKWANQAYLDGITSGCNSTNFCPSTFITRDQEAVMIENTYHLVGNPVPSIKIGINDGTTDDLGIRDAQNQYYVTLKSTASKAEPLVEVTNSPESGLVSSFKFELLTSIYRVTEKRVYDRKQSQPASKTTYSYKNGDIDTARVNDRVSGPTAPATRAARLVTPMWKPWQNSVATAR